jgi:hypothetical protein
MRGRNQEFCVVLALALLGWMYVKHSELLWFLGFMGVVLALLFWINMPKCKSCGSRSFGHTHRRVDGGPDRRYHDNPIRCQRCGALAQRK